MPNDLDPHVPIEPATNGADHAAVLATLRAQVSACRRLRRLATEQAKALADGDNTRLLGVLERRKSAIQEATANDDVVAPTRVAWPASVVDWPDEARDEAKALFGEIKNHLADLSKQDDRDAAGLRVRIATAGNELARVKADDRTVRRLNRNYAAAAYGKVQTKIDVRS